MTNRRNVASRPALSAAAITGLAALLGCSSTKPCNPGTVLVTVSFDSATSAADAIDVDVTIEGGAPKTATLAHTPGQTQGSVEVYFPNGSGYPEGKHVSVTVVARRGQSVLGTAMVQSPALPSGCGTLAVKLGGPGGDGGAGAGGGSGAGGGAGGTAGASGGTAGGSDGGARGGQGGGTDAGTGGTTTDGSVVEVGGCTEGTTRACTADGARGNCAAGTERCTGGIWSACSIVPVAADSCSVRGDDANCNGTANDGCVCVVGDAARLCSLDGAKGNCAKGMETCTATGKWSACSILPAAADVCTVRGDDANCNGLANEGCPCVSGDTQPCGPPAAVGICKPGTATCTNAVWGACVGAVNKAARDCTSTADNDCDSKPDNTLDGICQCALNGTQACGTHPGNDGKGPCKAGSQTCVVAADKTSSAWGACAGSVGPLAADTCVAGNDSNCTGTANDGCSCINGVTTRACGYCNNGSQTCADGKAGTYTTCAGATGQAFTALPLAAGWTDGAYGGPTAAVALDCSGMVQFKGALNAAAGNSLTLFTLPVGLRPPTDVYVKADLINATNGRIHFTPSGATSVDAEMATVANATGFTSLDGVTFALSATGFTALGLINTWANAPFATRNAAVSISSGIVRFQGAISTTGTNMVPFVLPAGFRPPVDTYLPLDLCGAAKGRLYITPDGTSTVQPFGLASTAMCFVSLEGLSFALSTTGFTALALQSPWTNAPFATRNAAVVNTSGIIRFQGAIAAPAGSSTSIFTLPVGFRPSTSVWLPVTLCDSAAGRINISSTGTVTVSPETTAGDATCFTSLEGVTFGL